MTRPPLPLAAALTTAVTRLCPEAPPGTLTGAALAIAGGSVIAAHVRWDGGVASGIDSGWRGRGIEEALEAVLNGSPQ